MKSIISIHGITFFVLAAWLPGCSDDAKGSDESAAYGPSSSQRDGNGDDAGGAGYYPADYAMDVETSDAPPDANEGDQYEDVGSNPFVMTAHDPYSTFAADVDTASYDIFRRDVNNGMLPQPESVRLEEYVNFFKYDYPAPAPDAEHPFLISLAAATSFLPRESAILRVGIQAEEPPPFEKKPTNLVFLIDVSGSMMDEVKLPLVQHLLNQTLTILDPSDTVAIVTYASDTGVRLPATPVSEKQTIEAEINSLEAGGSTAGASGIDLAYQQAEAAFVQDGINHVILCTDGDFNVGPSSDDALVALIEEKRETGITLTVLGFGTGNLNDAMMEKVSNAGNGVYAVISSSSHAERFVEERMLATIEHVAKDMKIQVEFNPEVVTAYRLLGYENRAIADDDFRDDTVDAGEVGAGHRVTALYELILTGGQVPEVADAPAIDDGEPVAGEREIAPEDMVLVKVRYKDVGAATEDPAKEVTTTMTQAEITSSITGADADFQWAAAVATFAEILKNSPYAETSSLPDVQTIVTRENWLDADRAEFRQLFESALPLITNP
jgi:Ca-activated chloride channel family protein